jgi:hypothetical protein
MRDSTASNLPPSGPWSGYYLYPHSDVKHRMRMTLTFTSDGKMQGDGIDDVAPFDIDGVFVPATNQAKWTKSYVGMHSVEYRGLYDGRTICGEWMLGGHSGGFWIWPNALSQGETETADIELEQPAELITV